MPQWRSIVVPCPPTTTTTTTTTTTFSDDSIVSIPITGWYGFCFGNEITRENLITALDETRPQEPSVACIQSPDSGAVRLCLPFSYAEQPLTWIHIGKLLYLTKGSTVKVLPSSRPSQPPSKEQAEAETEPPKWCLVFHRETTKDGPDNPLTGMVSTNKKSIICALCTRSFQSVVAIRNHFLSAHTAALDPLPVDSIWARPLRIMYQDAVMAVVVKPQGMPVMGDKRTLCRSNLLLPLAADPAGCLVKMADGAADVALSKPRPVHRLDAGTGGLLVLAKTKLAEVKLRQAFALRECQKQYQALVVGRLVLSKNESTGVCKECLSGQESLSYYTVARHSRSVSSPDGWVTVVNLSPHTGRKHQLRRHMQAVGHSIWGDRRYGGCMDPKRRLSASDRAAMAASNQDAVAVVATLALAPPMHDHYSRICLWAVGITMPHPITKAELSITMEDPEWLEFVIKREETLWNERNTAS